MKIASKGVVAIFTAPDGQVVASVSDFDWSGYGGFSLEEAQTLRAKRSLSRAVIDAFCSSIISNCMDEFHRQEIVRRMQDKGYRLTVIPVGATLPSHDEKGTEDAG